MEKDKASSLAVVGDALKLVRRKSADKILGASKNKGELDGETHYSILNPTKHKWRAKKSGGMNYCQFCGRFVPPMTKFFQCTGMTASDLRCLNRGFSIVLRYLPY